MLICLMIIFWRRILENFPRTATLIKMILKRLIYRLIIILFIVIFIFLPAIKCMFLFTRNWWDFFRFEWIKRTFCGLSPSSNSMVAWLSLINALRIFKDQGTKTKPHDQDRKKPKKSLESRLKTMKASVCKFRVRKFKMCKFESQDKHAIYICSV